VGVCEGGEEQVGDFRFWILDFGFWIFRVGQELHLSLGSGLKARLWNCGDVMVEELDLE
jgi:hypothetical protein